MGYLTSNAKIAFTQLENAFTKVLILYHFDLESYIQINTDASDYITGKVLSQLTLDNMGQWHLIVYFLKKMISAKTWYKTHNDELLAIIKAYKTWHHYLKGYKHKVFILTDYINLC